MIELLLTLFLAPCEVEDGSTQVVCYWDASEQGNEQGTDVLNVAYGRVYL